VHSTVELAVFLNQ